MGVTAHLFSVVHTALAPSSLLSSVVIPPTKVAGRKAGGEG